MTDVDKWFGDWEAWREYATTLEERLDKVRHEVAAMASGEGEWFFPALGFYEANSTDEMAQMFGELYTKAIAKGSWVGSDACRAFKLQVLGDETKTVSERMDAWGKLRGKLAGIGNCTGRYIDLLIQASEEYPAEHRYPDVPFTLYLRLLPWPDPITALGEAVSGEKVWSTRDATVKKSTRDKITAGSHLVKQQRALLNTRLIRHRDGTTETEIIVTYKVPGRSAPMSIKPGTAVPVLVSMWDQAETPGQQRRGSSTYTDFQVETTFSKVGAHEQFVWLGNCLYEKKKAEDLPHNAERIEPDKAWALFDDDETVWVRKQ